MIGAIIGDIVGSRFEFGEPAHKGFNFFKPECDYTDDTVCTIAVADAILHQRSYKESLQDWCRRYPAPMGGYGPRFLSWINSDDPQPNNSCGNGAAMRGSPVGWLFQDFDTVMEEAKKTAEVSHNHPEGIKGAQCTAALIYWLRTNRITKSQVMKSVKKSFGYDITPLEEINAIGSSGHFDAICQETVPWAIRCFIDASSFEETIRLAIEADGDTDTKGAIAGSIAEAYYEIPGEFIDHAYNYLPDDMLVILSEFYDTLHHAISDAGE